LVCCVPGEFHFLEGGNGHVGGGPNAIPTREPSFGGWTTLAAWLQHQAITWECRFDCPVTHHRNAMIKPGGGGGGGFFFVERSLLVHGTNQHQPNINQTKPKKKKKQKKRRVVGGRAGEIKKKKKKKKNKKQKSGPQTVCGGAGFLFRRGLWGFKPGPPRQTSLGLAFFFRAARGGPGHTRAPRVGVDQLGTSATSSGGAQCRRETDRRGRVPGGNRCPLPRVMQLPPAARMGSVRRGPSAVSLKVKEGSPLIHRHPHPAVRDRACAPPRRP